VVFGVPGLWAPEAPATLPLVAVISCFPAPGALATVPIVVDISAVPCLCAPEAFATLPLVAEKASKGHGDTLPRQQEGVLGTRRKGGTRVGTRMLYSGGARVSAAAILFLPAHRRNAPGLSGRSPFLR